MQITNPAYVVPNYVPKYEETLKIKGLNMDFIKNLLVNTNVMKIKLKKVKFLYFKLKKATDLGRSTFFQGRHCQGIPKYIPANSVYFQG